MKSWMIFVMVLLVAGCSDDSGDENNANNVNNVNNINNVNNVNNVNNINNVNNTWTPAPGTTWQWQLSDYPVDTTVDVAVYDVDLFDTDEADLTTLRGDGRMIICYFSAGSFEDWRDDAAAFDAADIGEPLDGWEGENWLDIRSQTLRTILAARLDHAVTRGCDAVEPDNVDGYLNETGFDLTEADQIAFNRWLATEAHARGLSVGLKNCPEIADQLEPYFNWALSEECSAYEECDSFAPFITANKAVFHVEYVDDTADGPALLAQVCADPDRAGFSTLVKLWDLDAWRLACE